MLRFCELINDRSLNAKTYSRPRYLNTISSMSKRTTRDGTFSLVDNANCRSVSRRAKRADDVAGPRSASPRCALLPTNKTVIAGGFLSVGGTKMVPYTADGYAAWPRAHPRTQRNPGFPRDNNTRRSTINPFRLLRNTLFFTLGGPGSPNWTDSERVRKRAEKQREV